MSRLRWSRRRAGADDPMTCAELARVLQRHLDGRVDATTAARVAEHLEACRRCGLEVETYESLRWSLRHQHPRLEPDSLARLRDFGERLARGDVDPDRRAPA